ncbi:dihydrolipoamide acetyltransferase family protein [Pseudarthrobacter sp. NPDC080039]|uniref:dihydrolipoamide acetyltransferase family protein n=1 Tax=unclassified Pseudarthrobacter TaxID=2647000 RepID=UPI003450A451
MAEMPLTMPKMSMTMEEGIMVAWFKGAGDTVAAGEPVCEVTTDKVEMEVESPVDGTLSRIVASPEDVIKVGDPIAFINTEAEDLFGDLLRGEPEPTDSTDAADAADGGTVPDAAPAPVPQPMPENTPESVSRPTAVPLARRLAEQDRLDLSAVKGTGPWGAVRVQDVEQLTADTVQPQQVQPAVPARPAKEVVSVSQIATSGVDQGWLRMRTQVAKVMSASALIPQFTAYADVDLSKLAKVRKTALGGASWTTILIKAQALALRTHHHLNDYWEDSNVVRNPHIGIGLAVDSERGLLAPVLHNPDLVPLLELNEQVRATAQAVREGKTSLAALSGGTAVFSNLGSYGVDSFNALLTPRQSSAISCGAVGPKVMATGEDTFGVRTGCTVGLTVDHRIADGADAARYLNTLREILSDPSRLGAIK